MGYNVPQTVETESMFCFWGLLVCQVLREGLDGRRHRLPSVRAEICSSALQFPEHDVVTVLSFGSH